MNPGPNTVLWTDFDGTAVETFSKINPRNWRKYPLPGKPGYVDFLSGAESQGVEIRGVASRRPELRRSVTSRSIAELGLSQYFGDPERVKLLGSESEKGQLIVAESRIATVGIIDDKPHKIGLAILQGLFTDTMDKDGGARQITLGVVDHPKSAEYTEKFISNVKAQQAETGLRVVRRHNDNVFFLHGPNWEFELSVVQLGPYTEQTGVNFAEFLHDPGDIQIDQKTASGN